MSAPLAGIKVVEVASWLAAPCCASLMADMGADVIKVEPPEGDTYRKMYDALLGDGSVHPCYQFDNRGKRGVRVNLEDPEADPWRDKTQMIYPAEFAWPEGVCDLNGPDY